MLRPPCGHAEHTVSYEGRDHPPIVLELRAQLVVGGSGDGGVGRIDEDDAVDGTLFALADLVGMVPATLMRLRRNFMVGYSGNGSGDFKASEFLYTRVHVHVCTPPL